MATVLSICNNRGGVGKTSSCQLLGEFLALIGKRVLLIDGDYSQSLTRLYYQNEAIPSFDLWDLIGRDRDKYADKSVAEFISQTYLNNLFLIPGSDKFEDLERGMIPINILKDKLQDQVIKDNFDYVVIDSHPSREELTKIIVTAGDKIVVPLFADMISFSGCSTMVNWIKDKCGREVDHLVISMYDNTKSAYIILYSVKTMPDLGPKLCKNIIPRANIIEAWKFKQESVVWKKPKHKAIEAYACLTYEILKLGTPNDAKKALVDVAEKRNQEIVTQRKENLLKANKRAEEKAASNMEVTANV